MSVVARIALGAATAVLSLTSIFPAGAAGRSEILAIPGSTFPVANYATPVAAVPQNGELEFVNLDIFFHDVVSVATTTDPAKWDPRYCTLPEGWKEGDPLPPCELFRSDLVPLLAFTPVLIQMPNGDPKVDVLGVYDFFCSIHPFMKGKLAILPPL